MNIAIQRLPRRNFLRGMGAMVALPWMESIGGFAKASSPTALARTASGAPMRLAFLYVPNGVIADSWRPRGVGHDFTLGSSLQPIEGFKQDLQIISQLEQVNGWPGPDGAGDHARATATVLTGMRPRKTAGADIQLGVSVDQVAADGVGNETRFRSLELTCDSVRSAGGCDNGYSCAYQFNLSWRNANTPMTPEPNPRQLFERLFGAQDQVDGRQNYLLRQAQNKSLIDFVLEDAKSLHQHLGRNDQRKLDEYLTSVREMEQRIENAERLGPPPSPDRAAPQAAIPESYREHIRLMMDMQILAFRTDSTRVSTLLLAHDGSNRSFKEIGISDGHHNLSHHEHDHEKIEKLTRIDHFYAEEFAYYLGQMKSMQDVDGKSLLDNSMVVYCSGLSDGNRHTHDNLPVIVAGNAGGRLQTGRHVDLGQSTPMCNLHLRLLEEMGVSQERFGDSTGVLKQI